MEPKPHEQRRGWLKNCNPPGNFSSAPRCGAKTRKGLPCLCPAMKNGRCRLHGGKSTGPKTEAGKKRIGRAQFKHGLYTKEAIASKREFKTLLKVFKGSLNELEDDTK